MHGYVRVPNKRGSLRPEGLETAGHPTEDHHGKTDTCGSVAQPKRLERHWWHLACLAPGARPPAVGTAYTAPRRSVVVPAGT